VGGRRALRHAPVAPLALALRWPPGAVVQVHLLPTLRLAVGWEGEKEEERAAAASPLAPPLRSARRRRHKAAAAAPAAPSLPPRPRPLRVAAPPPVARPPLASFPVALSGDDRSSGDDAAPRLLSLAPRLLTPSKEDDLQTPRLGGDAWRNRCASPTAVLDAPPSPPASSAAGSDREAASVPRSPSPSPCPSPAREGTPFEDAVERQPADPAACTAAALAAATHRSPPPPPSVAAHITDDHLLAFGALLGEECADAALRARGAPRAWGGPAALLGAPDTDACDLAGWELIVQEACPALGLSYWAWRRPLRAGLFLYRTHAVFDGADAPSLRSFQGNDRTRFLWDDTCLDTWRLPVAPAGGGPPTAAHADADAPETGAAVYRCRWPRPLSSREYVYVKRAWHRACDGGSYTISRAAPHEAAPAHAARGVRIEDYASCVLVRAAKSLHGRGSTAGGAEVVSLYFENPLAARASFVNLAVRKGLWPGMQRYAAAYRAYAAARARAGGGGRRASLDGGALPPRAATPRLGLPPLSDDAVSTHDESPSCDDGDEWAAMAKAMRRGGPRARAAAGRDRPLAVWRRRGLVVLATVVAIVV